MGNRFLLNVAAPFVCALTACGSVDASFVGKAAVISPPPPLFIHVDFGGVSQPGFPDSPSQPPTLQYTQIQWPNTKFDTSGGAFNNLAGTFTVPAGATDQYFFMGYQTWVQSGVGGSNPFTVTKLFLNGVDYEGCTGIGGLQFLGTSTQTAPCLALGHPGDVFTLKFYGTAACPTCTITLDGNKAHAYWGIARLR